MACMGFFLWLTGLDWSRREVTLSRVIGVTAPSNHRPNEQSDPKLDVANASFLIPLGKTDRHGMPSSHPLPSRTVSSPRPKPPRTLFLLLTYEFSARSAPSVSLPFSRISAALGSDGEGKRMCPGRFMRPASERITKASPPARRMGPALRFGGSFQYWILKGLSSSSPRRVRGAEVKPPGSERLPFRDLFPV